MVEWRRVIRWKAGRKSRFVILKKWFRFTSEVHGPVEYTTSAVNQPTNQTLSARGGRLWVVIEPGEGQGQRDRVIRETTPAAEQRMAY